MMTQGIYRVEYNRALAPGVWELRLSGDTSALTAPGQFINIKLDGFYLRRPISVCDWDGEGITVIYKVVGKGTAALSSVEPGQDLDILCGLGNGFDVSKCGRRTLAIGGGAGVPPMYALAKALLAAGKTPIAILGFNKKDEVFYEDRFRALGVETAVTTADGSHGQKGFVTDALPETYDFYCACGPIPMLKAVYDAAPTSGLLSFEERMGCGFGACMGCSCETIAGPKRICVDGPVMKSGEVML